MPYTLSWYEKPWLARVDMIDDSSSAEFSELNAAMNHLMDSADGHIYWLADMRDSGPEKGHPVEQAVLIQLSNFPILANPNCGQIALICSSSFARFMTNMTVQSPQNRRPGGVPIRPFDSMEAALDFLREVATVDKRLATRGTLPGDSSASPASA